ncbi:MAG: elongation factor 1-beta [Candidatus Bathyarchaeia archaeon]
MAKVLLSLKVMPAGIDVDLDRLREAIQSALPGEVKVARSRVEPIAFGLNALILQIVLPQDRGGDLEKVEEAIRATKGVGEIETLYATRV